MKGKNIMYVVVLGVVGYFVYRWIKSKYQVNNDSLVGIFTGNFDDSGNVTDNSVSQSPPPSARSTPSVMPTSPPSNPTPLTVPVTLSEVKSFDNSKYQTALHKYYARARANPNLDIRPSSELLRMSKVYGIRHNPKYKHKRIISKKFYPLEWAKYEYYAKGNQSDEVKKILGV